jgi:putative addiction module component (TIGR02574 family)
MADAAEVLKNALALGVEDRAVLAERLFASLDDLDEAEAERLWAAEARRRLEAYREGSAQAVDADQVAEKARRLFR